MAIRRAAAVALTPDSPLIDLPRATARDVRLLQRLGLRTVRDLLGHLPRAWDAYGAPGPVRALSGEQGTVVGTLRSITARRSPRQDRQVVEGLLVDDEGVVVKLVWFNQPYLARQLRRGQRLAVAGAVRRSPYDGTLEMRHPRHERLEEREDAGPRRLRELMPRYNLTEGMTSPRIALLVEGALPVADQLEDTVPPDVREREQLLPIADAVRLGHRPGREEDWERARRRMQFAEMLELQVAFLVARREEAQEVATPVPYRQEVIDAFKRGLDFELTHAQRRATWDVYKDLREATPMSRLLNGDVGSGKTAVAAAAAAMVHAEGLQTVVMAPTEILARQHLQRLRAYLEPSFPDLTVELLVSGLPAAERRRVRTAAASGHCGLLVGTHALIEDDVQLADLGLAVVDEQHRFGTRQREALREKAGRGRPHFLAMTATPIPRSLALAVYGEMALSVIDEMPPGRTPVETRLVEPAGREEEAYELVRREARAGRQTFVMCPLVEVSTAIEASAATKEYERLRDEVFRDLRVALVHGRIRDKDAVMRAFREGEADVLVATPVIEVGVDVPNATVILIEGAERFGLAQLHQFRGRVGRGAQRSYCLLLPSDGVDAKATQRLEFVARIHDGFQLAEKDMELRGAGELMGAHQHGMSDLAMQALERPELISEIRQEAERLLAEDPDLAGIPALRQAVQRRLDQTSAS
ncbi:MAG: ATP-dependent DNA helicase RecG [Candidatus Dormibacteraeota bacterium]|nr:ATP-dependent DNA helicase RecG [Candidatus Dormibacteraeota bacterium]